MREKILCLVQLPPPLHGVTAINSHVVNNTLGNADFDISLVDLDFSKSLLEMHGLSFKKVFKLIKAYLSLLWQLTFNRPDIVYFTFSPFGMGLLKDAGLVLLCRIFRVKVILHLHGTGVSKKKDLFHRALYKWLFSKDFLILLSPALYDDVSAYLTRDRCWFLPNAAPDHKLESVTRKDSTFRIVFMANLNVGKGFLTVIDVFADLVAEGYDVELSIVGDYTNSWGPDDMQTYISKFSSSVGKRITSTGPLYDFDKYKKLKESDVFFYPTKHDAFPLVVIEALSSGLPVITSTQGAIPEIIEHGVSGYSFDHDRVDLFKEQLLRFYHDRELLKQFSLSAKKRYEDFFTYKKFDDACLEIFRDALAK